MPSSSSSRAAGGVGGSSRTSARRRGSIRQRGKASWEIRAFAGIDPSSARRLYVTRTVRGTRRDAEVELTKLLKHLDDRSITPGTGSLGELVEAWYSFRAPSLSPPVAHNYRRLIDRFILPRWGSTPLSRIRPAELDAWYAKLLSSGGAKGQALSASSVRHIHALLHTALEQGVKWGAIVANPASAASPPSVHRRQVELKAGQNDWGRLIEAASEVNEALAIFVRLALVTGARRGELCALRWRDVDLSRAEVFIRAALVQVNAVVTEKDTKTHQVRRVSIDEATVQMLNEYRERLEEICKTAGGRLKEDSFVFSHDPEGSTPWRPNYVTLAFCRIRDRLGLSGLRLHDLRHASASLMLANGVDLRTVSARLGHAQSSTTLDIYAHVIPGADQKAAKALGDLLGGANA